jgi:hypothetical protein
MARPSFIIDSEFREFNSQSQYNFNYRLETSQNSNFTHFSLIGAFIPKTYYVVQKPYSQFILQELGVNYTANIPEGDYNISTLEDALELLLNTLSPSWTYTVSHNDLTNKFEFGVSGNGLDQPSFVFIHDQVNDILGFSDKDQIQTFVANKLISTRQLNLNHTKYVQIRSSLVDNEGNEFEDQGDILARIPASNLPYGGVIEYELPTFESGVRKIKNNKTNTYNFLLQDDHDRELNLNGFDWSFTIIMFNSQERHPMLASQAALENSPVVPTRP